MSIHELRIHHLRTFATRTFHFAPHLNFVVAANGAGKTSLLEAIYLLSCGHSFRSREIQPLITFGEDELTLFSTLHSGDMLSIQKSVSRQTRIKINYQLCHATSKLARHLPCQVYYQDIFALMDGGPSLRRTMLDWGVFHVEHSYHVLLKNYRQLLKHRNALLKQRKSRQHFEPWDSQLCAMAEKIHCLRLNYMEKLQQQVQCILAQLSTVQCQLLYEKGWDRRGQGETLYEQLLKNFEKDSIRGYTSAGAHQADIHFSCDSVAAKKMLSRGQQKMVLIAVKMAQTRLLDRECVHLLDDIFAELDSEHIQAVLALIAKSKGQFITTLLPAGETHISAMQAENIIRI